MKLDLERIPWRDWAVRAVVSYNSTRTLTEDFLHLQDREFQGFFPPSTVSINGLMIWDPFLLYVYR